MVSCQLCQYDGNAVVFGLLACVNRFALPKIVVMSVPNFLTVTNNVLADRSISIFCSQRDASTTHVSLQNTFNDYFVDILFKITSNFE